jgi:stromal membrane-associated protein
MPENKDKGQGDQLTKEQKILVELLKLPENKECADCGAKGPRWASSNLGVFICIKSSGIHRSLGTHISKVKSVSLDKWTPEQVRVMEDVGNGKAREIFESALPQNFRRPNESDSYALEQFIRAKYDRKEYMKKDAKDEQVKRDTARVSKSAVKKPKPIMEIKETVQVTKTTKIMDNGPDLIALNESEAVPRQSDPQFSVFQSATTTVTSSSFVSASPSMFPPSTTHTVQTTTTSQTDFGPFFSGNETQSASKASILQLYNTPLTQQANPMTPQTTNTTNTSSTKTVGGPNYDVVMTVNAPKPVVNRQPAYGVPYANPNYMAPNPSYVNPNFVNQGYVNQGFVNPTVANVRPMQMPVPNTNFVNTTGYVNPNFAAKMNNSTGKFM